MTCSKKHSVTLLLVLLSDIAFAADRAEIKKDYQRWMTDFYLSLSSRERCLNYLSMTSAIPQTLLSLPKLAEKIAAVRPLLQARRSCEPQQTIDTIRKLQNGFGREKSPAQPLDRQQGEIVFKRECAACHSQSDDPLYKSHLMRSPMGLFYSIAHGTRDQAMPAFDEKLSVNELWQVSFYVNSLSYVQVDAPLPASVDLDSLVQKLDGEFPQEWRAAARTSWPYSAHLKRATSTDEDPILANPILRFVLSIISFLAFIIFVVMWYKKKLNRTHH